MSELNWRFRKMQKHEMSADILNADSSKLVREAIQNSLDVKLDPSKSVNFRLELILMLNYNFFHEKMAQNQVRALIIFKCIRKAIYTPPVHPKFPQSGKHTSRGMKPT